MPFKWNFLLYLASQSSRRQEILRKMGLSFRVVPSRYHEFRSQQRKPEILAVRHAMGKVQKAVLPSRARFVLGGDTVVWHQGRELGKPRSRAEALCMLRSLAGKKHAVYTGLALKDRKTRQAVIGYAKTHVWLKRFSEDELRRYRDAIHPFDKAGAYAIQAKIKIVRKIQGSYSNVVGLPEELLRKMLSQMRKNMKSGRQGLKIARNRKNLRKNF